MPDTVLCAENAQGPTVWYEADLQRDKCSQIANVPRLVCGRGGRGRSSHVFLGIRERLIEEVTLELRPKGDEK